MNIPSQSLVPVKGADIGSSTTWRNASGNTGVKSVHPQKAE